MHFSSWVKFLLKMSAFSNLIIANHYVHFKIYFHSFSYIDVRYCLDVLSLMLNFRGSLIIFFFFLLFPFFHVFDFLQIISFLFFNWKWFIWKYFSDWKLFAFPIYFAFFFYSFCANVVDNVLLPIFRCVIIMILWFMLIGPSKVEFLSQHSGQMRS